ncbi:MAG: AI-2E family transporter [Nanoarchaeota archaeon]|nr:AI-2E family transporter [Nanoarchaeota archaeon]
MKYRVHIPLVVFAFFIILTFFVIKPIFLSIFVGALFAYIFNPVYSFILQKTSKTNNQKIAVAFLVCGLVLLILVVPAFFLVKSLVKESYALFILGKQKLAVGLFSDCTNYFCETIKDLGQNPNVYFQIQEVLKTATNWVIQRGSTFLISVPRMILNTFIAFFTMFYFLKDGDIFVKRLGDFLSMGEGKYSFIIGRLKEITHGIVYGYLLVALIQGILGALGFLVFGIQSPLFWGLLMALFALIPSLGTGIIWLPASVILFLEGVFQDSNSMMIKGIALFVYSAIIVGGIDNILKPKLVGDKAKIHPAIVMIGILGGIFFFGVWGVILGPLILSLTSVLIDAFIVGKL